MAQNRRGFTVRPYPDHGTLDGHTFGEALLDNTQTPVPDQVSFRHDFPAWLETRTERDRRIIRELMGGERTFDVSQKHRVSAARISQLRREYLEDWWRSPSPPTPPPSRDCLSGASARRNRRSGHRAVVGEEQVRTRPLPPSQRRCHRFPASPSVETITHPSRHVCEGRLAAAVRAIAGRCRYPVLSTAWGSARSALRLCAE